jgi:hypothetical protein
MVSFRYPTKPTAATPTPTPNLEQERNKRKRTGSRSVLCFRSLSHAIPREFVASRAHVFDVRQVLEIDFSLST